MSGQKRDSTSLSSTSARQAPAGAGAPPAEKHTPPAGAEAEQNYQPRTARFWLITLSALGSMLLVALDRTIVSTAIPRITDNFRSLGDIGWYGSAYMLTTSAFQLLFGRVYRFYDLRCTFLCCIVVFEAGSALCGAAPNSPVFIVGRAIAGVGSAGITTGSVMVIIPMVPLHKRPMFQSIFGLLFGVSSVAGPLIGGAFTERATWRWCFYMNLPVGVVAFLLLFFFLHLPREPRERVPVKEHMRRLNPLGTFFFVPSVTCLVLALQWGGSSYPWGNWRLVLLFVVFGVTAVQILMPETATLPLRVIGRRTMLASAWFMFFLAGGMMLCVYYVPLWFQTTHGIDPVKSGIYTIPLVLSLVVAAVMSGLFTQKSGYYVPSMLLGPCVCAIGEGLMMTFTPSTASSYWIGFQFLVGFGLGLGMQTATLAAQATLPKEDIATGVSIIFFAQQLGGAIFVSVGQTILSGLLVDKLARLPGLDPETIVRTGATELHRVVPAAFLPAVVDAYDHACTRIFLAALALAFAQLLCACCVEWRSIKGANVEALLLSPSEGSHPQG